MIVPSKCVFDTDSRAQIPTTPVLVGANVNKIKKKSENERFLASCRRCKHFKIIE